MKIILEFDNHEDGMVAIDGEKWRALVFEFDQKLRGRIKYEGDDDAEKYRAILRDLMEANGLRLY